MGLGRERTPVQLLGHSSRLRGGSWRSDSKTVGRTVPLGGRGQGTDDSGGDICTLVSTCSKTATFLTILKRHAKVTLVKP